MGRPMLARPRHLAAGLVAYLLSVGSRAYFAGFLAGLPVPNHIDSGAAGPPAAALAVDLALLLSFALVHSLLARDGAKAWLVPEL